MRYFINRLIHMDYKKFFKTIDTIHNETDKSKIKIFFDIVWCGIRYQAGYVDYILFEMYNLKKEERKNIITRGINNRIVKKFNDSTYNDSFSNKAKFNEIFNIYLNRDWKYLDNEADFKDFIKKHQEFLVKPLSLSCGAGIEKIKIKNNAKKVYESLVDNKQLLLEEIIKQNKQISKIYPLSVNSIRIVTLNHNIAEAYLRIGNDNNIVDNFNHGGMVTKIDIKTGIINVPAIDKKKNIYYKHPYSGIDLIGFEIPKWEEVIKLCIELSYVIPQMGYIAWDIAVGDDKLYLIEGNEYPGYDLYELPVHRTGKIGHLDTFKTYMD